MRLQLNHSDLRSSKGMSLVELLVAMFIGAVLITGLVQIAAGARSTFRLQENLAELQESGRFALDSLGSILRQSTYHPQPWLDTTEPAGLAPETADATTAHGDRLAIRTWSDRNCFGSLNPVEDGAGLPQFFLKESVLELNAFENLVHTCRYGQNSTGFVTQINRQGLVQNVEAFQAQFAEDTDGNGDADRWVSGGGWADDRRVMGLRLALLLKSSEPVDEPAPGSVRVLEDLVLTPADGKLRRVFTYSQALLGHKEW
ncbi:MAG TPA: PilW family protein [Xanthomonadales bacterium]|nr:PilW family protein [Xanthomonadales bacterium]